MFPFSPPQDKEVYKGGTQLDREGGMGIEQERDRKSKGC